MAEIARLPIHLNVPANHISAADYVVAVKSLETTIREFNKRIFGGSLEYEFLVLPTEEGSFKGVTGVIVKGVAKVVAVTFVITEIISFSETDTFKGLVKGLTGYELAHYKAAEGVGHFLRDMTKGIFTTENDNLERLIPGNLNLDKVFHAKAEFYSMCIANHELTSVGFEDSEHFPIKRASFAQHISRDKIRSAPSDFVLYRDTIIVSPVDTDMNRVWRLQDVTTKNIISAYMRDEEFKKGFLNGKYPLKKSSEDDRITVLVEYKKQEKNGEIEQKEASINTVYSFNDTQIAAIPDDIISKIKRADISQMDMFVN